MINDERDLLITLRLTVKSLEDRVGKVEDKLEQKYDIVIEKIENVDNKVDKREVAFWKYLACSVLSILATGGIELLINHLPR